VVSGMIGALVSLASAQGTKKPAPTKEKPKPVAAEEKVISDIVVSPSGINQIASINDEIEKKWKANKIDPSERCTDHEFIRRASLDIIGRIATYKEIDQFMKDPPRERRSRLIERLLEND